MNVLATRASLLLRLKDHRNNTAWAEFLSIYMPLLHSYAMKAGLQDSDAADIAQETIRQVFRNINRFDYQPNRGSFRGWLFTIARNLIRKHANKGAKATAGTGDSDMLELLHQQASPETTDQWESDYRMRIFHLAAEKVRQEFRQNTWQAFWRSVVEGTEITALVQELGMSAGAIYIARSRVTARIRDEAARLDADDGDKRIGGFWDGERQ